MRDTNLHVWGHLSVVAGPSHPCVAMALPPVTCPCPARVPDAHLPGLLPGDSVPGSWPQLLPDVFWLPIVARSPVCPVTPVSSSVRLIRLHFPCGRSHHPQVVTVFSLPFQASRLSLLVSSCLFPGTFRVMLHSGDKGHT